ncbi:MULTISPECIES: hypothetical protein [Bacteria]|uniref:WXG100 family type VII secretion target n=1 Tax=Streptomyces lonarensis TaxID=700599 RepID=A0A7X6I146_9ACTN|nr:hypothetical protein [Streptomyces lonarensis]NJQ08443.1 hypothetical protein [Streptomyces lonarensis]
MSDYRLAYDTAASGDTAENLMRIMRTLEALVTDHSGAVAQALSDFDATGVSEEYAAVEWKWEETATSVRTVISELARVLEENDITALNTSRAAGAAVAAIRS